VDDNCGKVVNLEHFISKSILELIRVVGGSRGLFVDGFSWQTEPKTLFPKALAASYILCKRHNEALGPLDRHATRFYRYLMNVPKLLREPGRKRDHLRMFSGPDLERWMIKALAGLLASGNAVLNGQKIVTTIPPRWLNVLMGRQNPLPGTGLGSMVVPDAEPRDVPTRIDFRPMFRDPDEPAGAAAWFNGLAFGLVLDYMPDRRGMWAADYQPHANTFKFTGPSSSVTILLAGPGWDESTGVDMRWSPSPADVETEPG